MATKSELRRRLDEASGFENPDVALEQYRTPPELAAHLVHTADLRGDIGGQVVVDLGSGTGMLALGATLRAPAAVVGIELDAAPLAIARENEQRIDSGQPVSWIQADATALPLSTESTTPKSEGPTVLMNPPFGAQTGNEHADRAFLSTTAEVAAVSYSIHNEGSYEFVESFVADNGGSLTDAFAAEFHLPQTYDFHTDGSRTIDVELFRIDWTAR